MQKSVEAYLSQITASSRSAHRFRSVLPLLSLMVIFSVFWGLKLTGITMAGEAFCGFDEHVHTEACSPRELTCTLPEADAHTHGPDCLDRTLTCTLAEQEGHTHTPECTLYHLTCPLAEGEHVHGPDCSILYAACGLEESEEHSHTDACMESVLTCTQPENHTHGEGCYSPDPTYTCGLEAAEAHFHTEDCYTLNSDGFLCGLEETEGHRHTDECYSSAETCTLEEHVHTANCYSDVNADLETADDWEMTLAGMMRSSVTAENVIMVAQSQLGYSESSLNFQVDDTGLRRGITRYGQWYGNPYGDWSAMFVSFCLDYAGVMDVPLNSGPESMRTQWEAAGLYEGSEGTTPIPGDLVFLDKDENGAADAVAILTKLEENVLFTIEGDLDKPVTQIGDVTLSDEESPAPPSGHFSYMTAGALEDVLPDEALSGEILQDRVAQTLYAMDDPVILGYGLLPSEPGLVLLPAGDPCYIWLDGTNGGLMALDGSPNTRVSVTVGQSYTLPTTWTSPSKYNYVLRGWYDVTNNRYYAPGTTIIVPDKTNGSDNMVFYADWAAASYDIGQFNAHVTDTVSTSDFVTIRMFDYGILFNVLSESPSISYGSNNSSHTETWSLLTSGNNPYNNQPTLNYIFRDWDRGSEDISYPANTNSHNTYNEDIPVHYNLYNNTLGNLLFGTDNSFDPTTGTGVIGKQYLGTADHLFQLMTDPSDPHYGYYYYNSALNAASYNQSDGRFYVYDYLERSTDSSSGAGGHSDFLPLNSPYANTNGNAPATYRYDGDKGEYVGTTHYVYEAKNNGDSPVGANYLFGMSVDIDFYLPNAPGSGGNKDLYGNDMHFKFSGDDDVWVFVDGKLVLDLGGIHGIESGDLNFSTGTVTIDGQVHTDLSNTLKTIGPGDHTLTIYYLERGSSQSNCALYFNLAPRFSFSIQKEDFLTRHLLNGAQFSVYTDEACTNPAQLWISETAHDRGEESTNVFTVEDGIATMWGLGAGNTYYIKETRPPEQAGYSMSSGIIRLTLDKSGTASYHVDMIKDASDTISSGFTVHGIRIDEETQQAYIIATNADSSLQGTTSVQAWKVWNDTKNHSGDSITVYLTVTDPDGTVRRIQEAVLGEANNWNHIWDNLPKYYANGNPIAYGVEEAYVPGYLGRIESAQGPPASSGGSNGTVSGTTTVTAFENGETYLIYSSKYSCYLAAYSEQLQLHTDSATATTTDAALWNATVNADGTVTLTNKLGHTLYYNNYGYFASTAPGQHRNLRFSNGYISCYIDHGGWQETQYIKDSGDIFSNIQYNYQLYAANNTNEALPLTLHKLTYAQPEPEQPADGDHYYRITNTPLEQETYVRVQKVWDYGHSTASGLHNQYQVTVKLLANGRDTGRTVTLTLRNNWTDLFQGLPYADENGNPITYTVEEIWNNADWLPSYGPVTSSGTSTPTYSTTVTNRYRWGMGGPELPSTGTAARLMYLLCGGSIMLTSLAYGIGSRRKRERRMK